MDFFQRLLFTMIQVVRVFNLLLFFFSPQLGLSNQFRKDRFILSSLFRFPDLGTLVFCSDLVCQYFSRVCVHKRMIRPERTMIECWKRLFTYSC